MKRNKENSTSSLDAEAIQTDYNGDVKNSPDDNGNGTIEKGLTIKAFYTPDNRHPFENMNWQFRDASIIDDKGNVIFEQKNVEFPLI